MLDLGVEVGLKCHEQTGHEHECHDQQAKPDWAFGVVLVSGDAEDDCDECRNGAEDVQRINSRP